MKGTCRFRRSIFVVLTVCARGDISVDKIFAHVGPVEVGPQGVV